MASTSDALALAPGQGWGLPADACRMDDAGLRGAVPPALWTDSLGEVGASVVLTECPEAAIGGAAGYDGRVRYLRANRRGVNELRDLAVEEFGASDGLGSPRVLALDGRAAFVQTLCAALLNCPQEVTVVFVMASFGE